MTAEIVSLPSKTTASKRLLFVAPQPFFAHRGSPLRVQNTVRALAKLGYDVDLLVMPFGSEIELEGVTIHRSTKVPFVREIPIGPSWSKFFLDMPLFASAFRLVRKNQYAALHGVEEASAITSFLGKLFKIPSVVDMHSCMSDQLLERQVLGSRLFVHPMRLLEKRALLHASGVLTVADYLTEKAQRIAPKTFAITIQDLALDSATVATEEQVQGLREQFAIEGKTIVYTGNFEPYQGIDFLLEAFSAFCARFVTDSKLCKLLIVGGESATDEKLLAAKDFAAALGLEQQVVFTGPKPPEQMGAFMALADVLVSPRLLGDNTPLKVYSYMAAKRPIVATSISSHTQVLNESCAFLAPLHAREFAAQLFEALREDEQGRAVAQARVLAASEHLQAHYSKEQFVAKIAELYQQVLQQPGLAAPVLTKPVAQADNLAALSAELAPEQSERNADYLNSNLHIL